MGSKNCPETPRQKMISMMYLVLTALLALNVSKDILDAFVTVNEGVVITNKNFGQKNESLFSEFEAQLTLNQEKVKPFYDKAAKAKQLSQEMIAYINDIKREIVAYTEFGDRSLKEKEVEVKEKGQEVKKKFKIEEIPLEAINNKSDYDKSMQILIGFKEDASDGKGMEIVSKLNKFKEEMLNLIPDPKEKEKMKATINFNTEPRYNKRVGKEMNWAYNTFYHTVLAANVVILNKVIADILNVESDIVAKLMESISKKDFKFDVITAKVIPKSNYVMQGESYEADIIVAAYDSKQNPEILIWTGADTITNQSEANAVKVEGKAGVARYIAPTGGMGPQKYAGVIKIKAPSGEIQSYHFKNDYIVSKPSLTVSADKMNVFYIGVDNPVSISVPGVPSENIKASILGGTLTKSGQGYIVRCTSGTTKATISVTADMGGGVSKAMGKAEFRVKRVPDPVAYIANVKEGPVSSSALLASGAIIPRMENFDFDLNFRVTSFTLTASVGTDLVEKIAQGNQLTEEMRNIIKKLRKGSKIYFGDISAKGPDGTTRKLGTIALRLQ